MRWLAHHTARLIHAADQASESGDPDAADRATEARKAILELWQARAVWPTGWPPSHAAEIAQVLDDLPALDDGGGWYRETLLAHLQDLHYHVLAVIVDLATEDGSADIEQGWLDAFGDWLTPDEVLLLRRAAERPRRTELLLRWWGLRLENEVEDVGTDNEADTDAAPTSHPLLDLADAYHATIVDLLRPGTKDGSADPRDDQLNGTSRPSDDA
jgi:hypothetical protein